MSSEVVFSDFAEYWHFVKSINKTQRDIIFNSLPADQQENLQSSYEDGGWEDIFMRNQIDKDIDNLKKDYNVDILSIRSKVLSGRSHFMKLSDWSIVNEIFGVYQSRHSDYVLGGLHAELENTDTVSLFSVNKKGEKKQLND